MNRILIYTMAILLVVPFMVFPASASTVYVIPISDVEDVITYRYNGIIPEGKYNLKYQVSAEDDIIYIESFEPIEIKYNYVNIPEESLSIYISESYFTGVVHKDGFSFNDDSFRFEIGYDEGSRESDAMLIMNDDDFLAFGFDDMITLTSVEDSIPMISSVTSCLTSSIQWCGIVIAALVSGDLSPLLPLFAVAVSIAALLLVPKIIKKYTWGA